MIEIYDRSVVLGVIAQRLDFISERDFVAGVKSWLSNRSHSLDKALVEQGLLTPRQLEILSPLVDEHLGRHGNEPLRSLQALQGTSLMEAAQRPSPETDEIDSTLSHSPLQAPGAQAEDSASPSATTPGSAASQPSPASSEVLRKRYQIVEFYKAGGLGEIYRAHDEQLGRMVALKQIKQKYGHADAMRERFTREAEINGRLEHPAIVPVYSLGRYEDGRPFYTMRFVAGEELGAVIKRRHAPAAPRDDRQHSLELRQLIRRFIDVCNAIAYAHSRGVVHRDLKPSNVLIGSFGETFLIDWGLAKASGEAESSLPLFDNERPAAFHTEVGTKVGTLRYMSPEQARGDIETIGKAADIYGLGALLYEIVTGQPPLQGTSADEVLRRAIEGQIPPPRSLRADIPRPLESICLKALSYSPSQRYESAASLAADVENWLADEPVEAHRDSPVDRLGRAVRRHRTGVVGVAVLLLATVAALGVISLLTRRQNAVLLDANTQITANFQQAQLENQRAEQNLEDLRLAAFELQTTAEGVLARSPGAETQRQRMTDLLVRTLEKALAQRPTDRDLRRDLAQACRIHANLQRLFNRQEVALDYYQRALSHLEQLRQTSRGDKKTQDRLAETLRDQSNSLEATGDSEGAVAALMRASDVVAALRRQEPQSTNYARTSATILLDLAEPLADLGRAEEALDSAARAAGELSGLVHSPSREPNDATLLLLAQNRQAEILRQLSRQEQSVAVLAQALPQARAAAEAAAPDARHTLARVLLNQAQSWLARDPAQSEKPLAEAIDIWNDLARKFPQRAFYHRYRALALVAQGRLRAQTGELTEAHTLLTQARDLLQPIVSGQPTAIPYREALADACLESARVHRIAGSHGDARQQFNLALEHLRQIAQQKPKSVTIAARLKAVEDESQQLADADN
jgi:eukaryotic-like serine/threonine-protein kinase